MIFLGKFVHLYILCSYVEASYFIKHDSIIVCILSEGTRNIALDVAGAGIFQRRTSKRTQTALPVEQH